jgi:predicted HicB family RNase H-like nuclease
MDKIKSIRFPEELEKKIRIKAAEEGISFGEWVRRVVEYAISLIEDSKP